MRLPAAARQPLRIIQLHVRRIDRSDARRPRRQDDATGGREQAAAILGDRAAHLHAEIGRAEDQRGDTRVTGSDLDRIQHTGRRLDHTHDSDLRRGQVVELFKPFDGPGDEAHLLDRAHLGQQDRGGRQRRHRQQVTVAGVGVRRIDAHDRLGSTEVEGAQRVRNGLAGQLLVGRCDGVLQVEDQAVGAAARGLGEHGFFVARDVQQTAAQGQCRVHRFLLPTAYCVPRPLSKSAVCVILASRWNPPTPLSAASDRPACFPSSSGPACSPCS